MKVQQRREAGYSLPEMLVVIAIIGLLALVTVPAFINFFQSNKMKASMRNFTTDLRGIRSRAIAQGLQTKLTYATGSNGTNSYDFWQGDSPFGNSPTWTRLTGTGANLSTKVMDNVVYFPPDGASTPQNFTDIDSDGTLDVIFFPNGQVKLPSGITTGNITIKTDMKITKPQYTITISPSGRVQAN
jgi:prepilin-type N-terminal cleavage/methylation domain-containing protein